MRDATVSHTDPHPDVAGFVLGALEPQEAGDFAVHLEVCAACQVEVAELTALRTQLDAAWRTPALPPGLAERTLAAVAREAESTRPGDEERPSAGVRRRPRRRVLVAAAAAAVAASTVGVLVTRPDAGGREIALVSADGAEVHAVATLRRGDPGVQVALAVEGLAPPPAGSHYECWYVGPSDTPATPARLTAGTFTVAASGRTVVHMTTAADHRRYPGIEVTLEPDDGNPARTGPVVLASVPRAEPNNRTN